MRNYFTLLMTLAIVAGPIAGVAQTRQGVDRSKYPDYTVLAPDYSLLRPHQSSAQSKGLKTGNVLPDHVNNAENKFFPPVFNQDGGSCGSASTIRYQMSYEINCYRGTDASMMEHSFPTHFTWLLTNSNSSKEVMARDQGVPTAAVYGGTTYSSLFGSQDCADPDFGWMQGYDKWFSAMYNRLDSWGSFPMDVSTEEGRENVKRWLWNHNGDSTFHAGGICGIGVASGLTQAAIPATAENTAIGVTGKKYVAQWGSTFDHALTIVGYDDRIEFDLNGNGIYGETSNDEKGAWIIANSWGNGWANGGLIYCPYKYAGPYGKATSGYFTPGVLHIRKVYRPLRTFKILMDYSKRSELLLGAGIAQDTSATTPDQTIPFEHFKYAGDGDNNGVDAETPMLGRWGDGMHYEPMEFGYDLTSLTANYDRTQPLKYFFYITSKAGASGKGHIYHCSLMDYEFDQKGIEQPFNIDTVQILNGGKTTMIAVTVMGEPVKKPLNLTYADGKISWQAPVETFLPIEKYEIFADQTLVASVSPDVTSYTLNASTGATPIYTVAALYRTASGTALSEKSNGVYPATLEASTTNTVRQFNNSGFDIPDVFMAPMNEATIEFWLKPTNCVNYNQQIGPGWNTFLFHTQNTRNIVVGWNTGADRITSIANLLTPGAWGHVAITVKGNVMTLYYNGRKMSSLTSFHFTGMPAMGHFTFGSNGSPLNGQIDEVRLWRTARSQADIVAGMRTEITNPSAQEDLMAYFRMDEVTENGVVKLRDSAHGHHATLLSQNLQTAATDETILTGGGSLKALFTIPTGTLYAGTGIQMKAQGAVGVASWIWNAPGAGVSELNVKDATLVFPKAGTYPVTLTVKDLKGVSDDTTMNVTVTAVPRPVADFSIANASLPAGDHFSFINKSQGVNCRYVWSMKGAQDSVCTSVNAGATYLNMGKYDVTLTATNEAGSQSVTKQVEVTLTSPLVSFNVHPSAILKGDKVYLNDASLYQPTKWLWTLESNGRQLGITGAHTSFTPAHPGYYDVTMTASNGIGENTLTQKRIFIVSNADAKTGLHFAGNGERVQLASPITEQTTGWSIDWWMYPSVLKGSLGIASGDSTFWTSTDDNGAMTIGLSGKTGKSTDGFVVKGEWHHYAVTFRTGRLTFYRDGQKISSPSAIIALSSPAWTGGMTIGSKTTPFNGIIDELRFWKKGLTQTAIQNYCNQPIANVDSVEKEDGLMVYYQFNQNSGNVIDATSNKNDGTRVGFGPDGDAWNSSLGVFTLDFSTEGQTQDVTAAYLTNYKRPFRHLSTVVNSSVANRFYQLETGTTTSTWKMAGAIVTDTVTTEAHVDAAHSYDLTMETQWSGFMDPIYDHRVYQTVTLPAGIYTFSIETLGDFQASGCFIAATAGDTLSTTKNLDGALASSAMTNKTITFKLTEDTKVSLGVIYNMSGKKCVTIDKFTLVRTPYTLLDGDGLTSIYDAVSKGKISRLTPVGGGLRFASDKLTRVRIYTLSGQCVMDENMSGTKYIQLPKGIYVADGEKFAVE